MPKKGSGRKVDQAQLRRRAMVTYASERVKEVPEVPEVPGSRFERAL